MAYTMSPFPLRFGARQGGGGAPSLYEQVLAMSPAALYDPSQLDQQFQASNGTGAVTADGDRVGRANDLSGNNRHALQSTADARLTYKTAGGLHWWASDDADDELVTATSNITLTPALYSAFSGQYTANAGVGIAPFIRIFSSTTNFFRSGVRPSNGRARVMTRGASASVGQVISETSSDNTFPAATNLVVEGVLAAGANSMFINGVSVLDSNTANGWTTESVAGANIGLCPGSLANGMAVTRLYGGVVFTRLPSSGERAIIREWLASMAGVSL